MQVLYRVSSAVCDVCIYTEAKILVSAPLREDARGSSSCGDGSGSVESLICTTVAHKVTGTAPESASVFDAQPATVSKTSFRKDFLCVVLGRAPHTHHQLRCAPFNWVRKFSERFAAEAGEDGEPLERRALHAKSRSSTPARDIKNLDVCMQSQSYTTVGRLYDSSLSFCSSSSLSLVGSSPDLFRPSIALRMNLTFLNNSCLRSSFFIFSVSRVVMVQTTLRAHAQASLTSHH